MELNISLQKRKSNDPLRYDDKKIYGIQKKAEIFSFPEKSGGGDVCNLKTSELY
ncbi:MAG: hypothetical protein IKD44_00640 [Lentisphaeria bacterium]|nr:hypothetical protein [Lentisphaeria bacterium]